MKHNLIISPKVQKELERRKQRETILLILGLALMWYYFGLEPLIAVYLVTHIVYLYTC